MKKNIYTTQDVTVKEITTKTEWSQFLENSPNNYFLQTWEWGDFNEKGLGKKVWRLGFFINEKLVSVCLCVEEKSRFGKFVYCPRGPILDWEDESVRPKIVTKLSEFFRNKGIIFLRIDPAVVGNESFISREIRRIGFIDAATFVQVERAWMLDIKGKSDDELMKGMRKNSRYYLRKAIKSGIKVRVSDQLEDLEIFIKMIQELAFRKNFPVLPPEYFRKQYEYLVKSGIMKIFVAELSAKPVASALIAFHGNEGSYLHAASDPKYDKYQPSYALQWEAIKHAREIGLDRYNFWGVVEDKNYHPGYPGFGYSNFKKGFGGYLEKYMRAKDYCYSNLRYYLVSFWEYLRRLRYKGN